MRRYVPRTLLTAAVTVSAAALTAGAAEAQDNGTASSRYQVLIPALEGSGGDRVSNQLRNLVNNMATHISVNDREMRRAMSQYRLRELDEITARQLAAQMGAQLVAWGSVEPGGAGLTASVRFVDVRSGDEIEVQGATGGNQNQLAQAIFAEFEERVEGIRQAAFCNDYLSSEQFEQALETCERALTIVPRSTAALYGKATAQLNMSNYDQALATYNTLLEIDPAHQDALLGAGLAASRLDQGQVAMGFYNRYLEIDPGNLQVRMTVANDVAQTGDFVNAFHVLEPAIADNQDDADFQRYLFAIATAAGQRIQEQQDRDAARPYFQAALTAFSTAFAEAGAELEPSQLRQAIAVNNALGNSQEALRLAQQGTQRFASDPAIWSLYATVLTENRQHAEAVTALNRVVELDPNFQDIYIRRGIAQMEAGNRQQAVADLQRAAQGGDRDRVAQVLHGMGGQLFQQNQFDEAVRIFEIAHGYASGTRQAEISFLWGFSVFRQGEAIARANTDGNPQRAEQALALFRRALPLIESGQNASRAQALDAARQYIENQEAILRAARR